MEWIWFLGIVSLPLRDNVPGGLEGGGLATSLDRVSDAGEEGLTVYSVSIVVATPSFFAGWNYNKATCKGLTH